MRNQILIENSESKLNSNVVDETTKVNLLVFDGAKYYSCSIAHLGVCCRLERRNEIHSNRKSKQHSTSLLCTERIAARLSRLRIERSAEVATSVGELNAKLFRRETEDFGLLRSRRISNWKSHDKNWFRHSADVLNMQKVNCGAAEPTDNF